jgi:hypothetical protein
MWKEGSSPLYSLNKVRFGTPFFTRLTTARTRQISELFMKYHEFVLILFQGR